MQFAKWVFRLAGIYGIVTVAPLYLLEGSIARATRPISHPEYFYGFVGLCVVWQIMFLLISRDPSRWRPAMPVALLEKLSFSLPVFALYAAGRVDSSVTVFAAVDLVWAALFATAYLRSSTASITASREVYRGA
jgi:uncharacterized membrane protein YuzA (DUF378 family)